MTRKSILDLPMASIERDIAALSLPSKHEPPRMTAQTTTQRTAKHRLAVKERMARMETALLWIYDHSDEPQSIQKAYEGLKGSASAQIPINPTQRGS